MWTITWLIVLLLSVVYLFYRRYLSRNLPPGPLNLPIIGALYVFGGRNEQQSPPEIITTLANKHGPIFGMWMGSLYTVVLSDPDLMREAFRKDEYINRPPLFMTTGLIDGKGIIFVDGPLWKDHRKFSVASLRHLGMVKTEIGRRAQLEERIMRQVRQLLKTIEDAKGHDVDMATIMQHNLGNVLNDITYGKSYAPDDETWIYLQKLQTEGVENLGLVGVVNFFPILRYLPHNKTIWNYLRDGQKATREIQLEMMNECEKRLKVNNYEPQEETNIMELLLIERHKRNNQDEMYNDGQIHQIMNDLFGAGLDTTFCTVLWFFLNLAIHADVQDKLRQELNDVLPNSAPASLEYYDSLHYFRACTAETQRIRNVLGLGIPHGTSNASELAGYHIPANTMVIPLLYAVHMNPKAWPEPNEFRPERFIDESTGSFYSSHTHFIPFQMGKRMCPGDDLAKWMMFLFSANVLRKYRFELAPGQDEKELLKGTKGLTFAPVPYMLRFKEV